MENRITNKENQEYRVNWVGQIKVGMKSKEGIPMSLDYFRADSNVKKYIDDFTLAYGEKPSSIEITFATNDMNEIFFERYEIRTSKKYDNVGGKLFAFGDGKEFFVWNEKKKIRELKYIDKDPDLMKKIEDECGGKWKATLTLFFIPLRIKGLFAPWKLTTRGEASSIKSIISEIDRWYGILGKLSGIPFDLVVKKVKSDNPGSINSYPVISLHCNVSPANIDLVKNYLNNNNGFQILTDDRISQMTNNEQNKIDYVPEETSKEFKRAENILRQCVNKKDLENATIKIKQLHLSDEDRDKIIIIYKEIKENLK